jgi:serine/threonine-protein kinase
MPTVSFNQHFPGYEILGELGRSNARVLKARNQVTGELVAIKHFAFNTDPETIHRFQRESEIMTSIQHPYIVKIRDVQLEADFPYIVMELVEGGDLRSLIKERGHLDIPTTIRMALQMLEAFRAIHEKGIIHRDIKPENIMYRYLHSSELHFLLTDFGIAKLREQPGTLTGSAMMTYEYASPEQFDNPKNIGLASDYYSLGVVLFECLTGKVPFPLVDGRVHTLMNQVMGSAPPPIHLPTGSRLPKHLEAVVTGLLAKSETNRLKDPALLKKMLKKAEIEDLEEPEDYQPQAVVSPARTMQAPVPPRTIVQPTQQQPQPTQPPLPPPAQKKESGYKIFAGVLILAVLLALVFLVQNNEKEKKVSNKREIKRVQPDRGPKAVMPPGVAEPEPQVQDSVPASPGLAMEQGVFFDDFSNNDHQWSLFSDSNKNVSLIDGKLVIEGFKNEFSYSSVHPFKIDLAKNYTVSVNARWLNGNDNSGFGLNYGSSILTNSYNVFFLSSNGHYSILNFENNKDWQTLKPWTRSEHINTDNTLNVITVNKEGEDLKFFINDNLVETLPDNTPYGNAFGVRVSGTQKVEFDNFILKGTE